MTEDQLVSIRDTCETEPTINIGNLTDQSDRTLLYGYTCERNNWHVYTSGGIIIVYSYNHSHNKLHYKEGIIHRADSVVPDKRLYPECCDWEFCLLLKQRGVYLPFTVYRNHHHKGIYCGEIL